MGQNEAVEVISCVGLQPSLCTKSHGLLSITVMDSFQNFLSSPFFSLSQTTINKIVSGITDITCSVMSVELLISPAQ